jgi:3-oxoacyl-[acyl-carrier protein] reductase
VADQATIQADGAAASGNGVPVRVGCALVTGASRGLGAAIARALAADGWPVGINYRTNADAALAVGDGVRAAGGQALEVGADLSDPSTIDTLFGALEEQFGRVSVLVNNAGIRQDGLALQLDDDHWRAVLETNLMAAQRTTKRALRGMIRQRYGRVVNIASIVGLRASPGQANYAASKAGLIAFTKTVAAEVARRGVTVNAVAPGLIATDMTKDLSPELVGFIPARRAGTPEDVAACVRFLASDGAAYVTGTTLTVDGGLSA